MAGASLVFDIFAKDHASDKFDKVGRSADGVGGKFKKFGKALAVGAAAGAGVAVVAGKALFNMGKEAEDAQRQVDVLTQTFKSMGGANSKAFKDAIAFSGDLSKSIAVDDGEIQKVQTKLATFGNVWKDPVKGADNFKRATTLAFDLAAAGFGSADGNAAQLGKALNDPTKGMAALAKSGVTFTQAEKNKIKALQESGNLLGAQEILYKAIEGQVGGVAKANATGTQKMAVAWGEIREQVGSKVLPVMLKLSDWALNTGLPAISRFVDWFSANVGPKISAVVGVVMTKVRSLSSDFRTNFDKIKSTVTSAISIIQSLWNTFGSTLISYATNTFNNLKTVISGAFTIISGIFKTFSALLKGDWSGVWDGIKQVLSGALTVIKGLVSQALNVIKTSFRLAWNGIKSALGGVWGGIKSVISNGINSVVNTVKGLPGKLLSLGSKFKSSGTSLIKSFVNGLSNAGQFVSNIAGNIKDAVKGSINAAIGKIESAISFKIDWPGPGSYSFNPHIPRLAKGGVVPARPGGTLALVGEAGHDEAVIPLSGPNAPRMGGGQVINIYVTGTIDDVSTAKAVQKSLLRLKRTNGGQGLGLA